MNLKELQDQDVLFQTKQMAQKERQLLTQILHLLREVERRKLFCDLGYKSLFEYTVKELKYSEGQAGRRIQAMRLLKELPQLEEKIETGALSLSNISQAQSYFREMNKLTNSKPCAGTPNLTSHSDLGKSTRRHGISSTEKLELLQSLEHKSAREGQKILIRLNPDQSLPQERQRQISETHIELKFALSEKSLEKLEEVRSHLGARGNLMNMGELVDCMAAICLEKPKEKNFGKRRTHARSKAPESFTQQARNIATPTSELRRESSVKPTRYVSRETKHLVWNRDQGRCQNCQGQRNLNIDHILPFALSGNSHPSNLRLLCFHCNQRQAIKAFPQSTFPS
ncbi:MAG: hypothetical protein CL676_09725 [Bdellovibrionaceae bacterium]|nr:hypothetical protein [Pseudobdellovibrionaceae bacterium]|tara:strand:- start:4156 stop:5175 length:1020 start_codon:yes stop_codon:yes gene_type:complete